MFTLWYTILSWREYRDTIVDNILTKTSPRCVGTNDESISNGSSLSEKTNKRSPLAVPEASSPVPSEPSVTASPFAPVAPVAPAAPPPVVQKPSSPMPVPARDLPRIPPPVPSPTPPSSFKLEQHENIKKPTPATAATSLREYDTAKEHSLMNVRFDQDVKEPPKFQATFPAVNSAGFDDKFKTKFDQEPFRFLPNEKADDVKSTKALLLEFQDDMRDISRSSSTTPTEESDVCFRPKPIYLERENSYSTDEEEDSEIERIISTHKYCFHACRELGPIRFVYLTA